MKIRRTWAGVLLLFLVGSVSAADWKSELLAALASPHPDYRRALEFLTGQAKNLEGIDRQTADALIPFLASKTGDRVEEQDRISEYFEKYRDNDPDFGFLDDLTRRDFLSFWARWKAFYPLVSDLRFLSYLQERAGSGLPASIDIGFDLLNDAYYKLSVGPYTLEGGFWPRGFHIVTVPAARLFDASGTYELALDLKAGDLIVRKPISIGINISVVGTLRPPPPAVPPVEDSSKPRAGAAPQTALEGELSLFIDGKLVLKSRKIAPKPVPIDIPIPGPSMQGTKPYMPPPKTDPMASSVSILDAIALTYKALKDLLAKKPPAPLAPSYQKVTSLSYTFVRARDNGGLAEARADLALDQKPARILRR
jgi:hypothetical protein